MFTGIIQSIGRIKGVQPSGKSLLLTIEDKKVVQQVKNGSSVSVNGVCLTVHNKIKDSFVCEVIPETLKKTTLGQTQMGDRVNLETSLRVGDEVSGHFVYGHVDGVGEIAKYRNNEIRDLVVTLPRELVKYIVPHGSIAVDGVSLTVAAIQKDMISVALTDFTLKNTTLGHLKKGDTVNLECDMIIKVYVQRYLISQIKRFSS